MNRYAFRIATALLTFFIGVTLATAWVFRSRPANIDPVDISTLSSTSRNQTLEMVFVLDTTSSMIGLIDGAKQKIWGIVNDVMQSPAHPAVRVGLVGYRDRGDEYVTTILPLTNDLDKVYTTLMNYQAVGGGDAPEDVRRALLDGVRKIGWSQAGGDTAQIMFLVGDAPPHNDYRDEPDTRSTAAEAAQKGIIVNSIQCGNMPGTQAVWQEIARIGRGQYFSIAQDGGVQAITTPYDEELGQLATKLGGTFVAYGGGAAGEAQRELKRKEIAGVEATVDASAPTTAKAERAVNKALNAEAYVGDLLQNIENGTVKLDTVKDEDLPSDLRELSVAERKQEIEKRLAERKEIRAKIMMLSKQRQEFIAAERQKRGEVTQRGFDDAVSGALKEQLARKGIK